MADVHEKIWYEDLGAWFGPNNFHVILPMADMTTAEKLNALTRFFVYLGVILALLTLNYRYLFFGIVACLMAAALYEFDRRRQGKAEKFLDDQDLAVVDRTVCSRPTLDNPFMNPNLVSGEPRPQACNPSSAAIQESIQRNFNARVFKDGTDIYGRNASQREFYTVPSTTPGGDQGTFARWLYGTGPTCKEGNGVVCHTRLPSTADVHGGPVTSSV